MNLLNLISLLNEFHGIFTVLCTEISIQMTGQADGNGKRTDFVQQEILEKKKRVPTSNTEV